MLKIRRHLKQSVNVDDNVVTLLGIEDGTVLLGFQTDASERIVRSELVRRESRWLRSRRKEAVALRIYNELHPGNRRSVFESIPKEDRPLMMRLAEAAMGKKR